MKTAKADTVKKNFIFQLLSQISTVLTPVLIYPYISRIFGTNGFGILSFTNSVIYYFLAAANLGIVNYGAREIAKVANNEKKRNKCFWGIFYCHLMTTIIAIFTYIVYVFFSNKAYLLVSICQMVQIVAVVFDISWFFAGMQKITSTAIINVFFKVVLIVFTFWLVKKPEDIYIYVLLLGVTNLLGHLLIWKNLKGYIHFYKPSSKEIFMHMKPLVILCIPVIAIGIYKYMDKIMIENLSSTSQLGIYEAAEKVVSIPLSAITTMGLVLLPKMANLTSEGKDDEYLNVMEISFKYSMLLAIGLVFGIIAVTPTFIPVFFGNEFIESENILYYLTLTVLFSTWSNTIRSLYLIPRNKDKEFVISILCGAFINIILNLIFIPRFDAIGAVIGTIAAEFIVALMHTIYSYHDLNFKRYMKSTFIFYPIGIIMTIIVRMTSKLLKIGVISLGIQIALGGTIYLLLCFIYLLLKKDSVLINNINKIKTKFKLGGTSEKLP